MISKIIESCLKNRFLVVAVFSAIVVLGVSSMTKIPVDAIPDIGELQVIVYADWPGRSPQDVEDQVIYPLTAGLMGTPKVKVVRSSAGFGFGMVSMIFKEGTDYYWARTRVLERLDSAKKDVPNDVTVSLGPDATALGQILWYTVEGEGYALDELRSIQDWFVRYQLTSVQGVSEVASVGGYVKQYQVDTDPNKLFAYDVSLLHLMQAIKLSNIDVGAKVFEEGGLEYIVRGVGFIKTIEDIENIVVGVNDGTPVTIKDIGRVSLGADFRRGALDKEGREVTGGVVVMRYGENPLAVIKRIKEKITEISVGLPEGVKIVPFYDRTGLINRSIYTLKSALVQEIIITVFVVLVFLLHFWGSVVISLVLPIGVLIAFILMHFFGVNANIMSLGGIAIAIGVMVDSGCVIVENIYSKLAEKTDRISKEERLETCLAAAKEVGRPVLFALLTTIVSFVPVFVLTGQAGKLFHPLAYTKTFAMAGAAIIALTLLPTLCYFLLRGRIRPVEENKVACFLRRNYKPLLDWSLIHKRIIIVMAVIVLAVGLFLGSKIKQEFMPALNEGDLLFMPVLLPGASLTQVMEVMQKQDIIIKEKFPEVERVVGKLGRAETATDPAPVTMIETIISLKEKKFWRPGMTRDKLIKEIQEQTKMPGVSPIMTQPIRNRIDMLATGIQTPVGIKVFGPDLKVIERIGIELEGIVSEVEGAVSPYAERVGGRPYFEMEVDREQAARYGIHVQDIQDLIMWGIGGMNITQVVQGRQRYPVRLRYLRELRDNEEALKRILVPTRWPWRNGPKPAQIPLAQLVKFKKVPGPAMILSENTVPYARVFIGVDQSKVGLVGFVDRAKEKVEENIKSGKLNIPPGYFISWSGQFEAEMESRKKLVPSMALALIVILVLLYIAFKNASVVGILAAVLPISLMGGVILMFFLNFRFSTAVWVGFIALFGVATDNAVVLLSTMEDFFKRRIPKTVSDLRCVVVAAALQRVRPALMTTTTTIIALMPVMFSTGSGSEIMRPMAAPTVGGLFTATLANLVLVPVLYAWFKERQLTKKIPKSRGKV
ncbi:MAG: CusA/CzcA family heavy metal efflux RND transporter [Candidatus Omnitrophica bacterium]|nr:CusA/CzcA family heavy metal efflux RND transporter [Candidatus Omnitrophota bacterium]